MTEFYFAKKFFALASKNHTLKFSSEMETDALRVIDNYKEHPDYDISFMLETHTDEKKTRMIFCENPKEKTHVVQIITRNSKSS